MKIVVIGDNLESATGDIREEVEIMKAINAIGHEAVFINMKEWRMALELEHIDYAFVVRNLKFMEQEVQELRNKLKCKILYWQPDYMNFTEPKVKKTWLPVAQEVDLWIGRVSDPKEIMWYKKQKINFHYWNFDVACHIFNMEEANNVQLFYPQTKFPERVPINFIGNWVHDPFRMKFLYNLQQHFPDDLHITTYTLDEYRRGQIAGKSSKYKLKNIHHPLFGRYFNRLVGITDINLAIDWKIAEGYWSPRIARIMCAGGFVLAHYVKGMREVFEDNIVYFNTLDECIEKIKYYQENDKERRRIARRGYQFANKYLRPENRVKDLINYLEKYG